MHTRLCHPSILRAPRRQISGPDGARRNRQDRRHCGLHLRAQHSGYLFAGVGLVIVNGLKDSSWGAFTIGMTIPIALLMGVYLALLRPGRVLESFRARF